MYLSPSITTQISKEMHIIAQSVKAFQINAFAHDA